jgi:predicted metallo-beta-lactamase superfamily hydrolase
MFEVACTPKVEGAWLTVDHPARYPNWASELIWFDKKLLLKTAFEDLNIDVVTRAKAFLRAAKPLLRHE